MASRRPTDDEEDESTALDLGRDIASATRKPVAPPAQRGDHTPAPVRRDKPQAPPAAHASDDDEDTDYLAVRPSSSQAPSRPSSSSPPQRPSSSPSGKVPVAPRVARDVPKDEDDTEFLVERPTGQSLSLKAISQVGPEREMRGLSPSRRAVPLGEERSAPRAPVPPAAEPPRAPPPRGAHRPVSGDEESEVTEPPQRAAAQRSPSRDADDGRGHDDDEADITEPPMSMPRVTRFFVAAAPPPKKKKAEYDVLSQTDPGDDDDEARRAPQRAPETQHRPLPARADMSAAPLKPVTIIATTGPNPFKRETTLTRSAAPTTGNRTAEADSAPADGLLVIEVPEGAVVIVDGEERGEGPQVRVDGLHRYARHSIKVHAPGFLRWSGSVSLEGRTAAKVRPALKKK